MATTRPSCRSRSSARTARGCTRTCRSSRADEISSSTGVDDYHLSKPAKAFIAGLLVHAREMSGVLAQWVNSYKRLVPGYEAPVYVAWSQRNRSALIRIPLYKPGSEQATRAEIRCPDPACNPYLAFAALLHAGLEGIEQGYELPDPMDSNLYRLTPERAPRARDRLAARVARRGDRRARRLGAHARALGEHIFPRYVELKRKEWDEYRVQVTEWEKSQILCLLCDDSDLRSPRKSSMMRPAGHAARRAAGLVSDGRSRAPG